MDLSTLPTRLLLRWDLAIRIGLSVLVPVGVQLWRTGSVTGPTIVAALVAVLVSMSSLGPEASRPQWIAVAAVGTPVAIVVGTVAGPSAAGGAVWVFLLYLAQGALTEAGLVSQLAWYPVATAGMAASVLSTGVTAPGEIAVIAMAGSLWSVLLMVVVPRLVRAPRVPVPAVALTVDMARLRRMARHPALSDWVYPLMLGSLASALLLVVDALTGGFRPYWAVFALVGVLAPTSAAARRSTWETVGSTLAGILLAAWLMSLGLSTPVLFTVTMGLALVGAVLLLRNGLVSKLLLTPLAVIMAAASLGPESGLALSMRLAEYLLGAGVGFMAAFGGEWLTQHLERDRPVEQADLAG